MTTGNSRDTRQELHLPVSEASIRSAKRMLDELAKARSETKEILGLFKSIQDTLKTMRGLGLMQGNNGRGTISQMFEGERFRAGMTRDRLAFDATNSGKKIANEKEYTRLVKEGLKFSKENKVTQDAIAQSQHTRTKTLLRINDLQEAMNRRAAVEKRLGYEIATGKRSTVKAFERQLSALDQVIARLRKEKQLNDQISKAREHNVALETAQAEAARRKTLGRLFGDGGAGLFAVQSGILANYAALNAGRDAAGNTFQFSAELDESLRNLQAITRTTDDGMKDLKESLIDVSEQTKFTAVEVTNAAVTLGQAGLSVDQIKDASAAVSLLATATGTDLDRAVDIATSTLGVFNMESSRMGDVANIMTEAVNSSKLNIEKLTLGLQYSGNIAAQSGLQFEELTAAMGAMANAGIRSGSTLGTGTRQILISLQKPSGEFLKTLERLGLTMEDVNLRSKGLYGVLNTLQEAGFTSADAIRSFEVRAASAFNALMANKNQVLELESAFLRSSAATEANETQMRSLNNQGKRLASVLGSLASTGFEPILYALRDTAKFLGDVGEALRDYPNLLRAAVVGVTALGAAWAAFRIKALVAGLWSLAGGVGGLTTAAAVGSRAIRMYGLAAGSAAIGIRMFKLALGPLGLALGVAAFAMSSFMRESNSAENALAKATAAVENAQGVTSKYAQQISTLDGKIQELRDRYDELNSNSTMLASETQIVRDQFVDMGYDVMDTASTVDGLIGKLSQLRTALSEKFVISLGIEGETIKGLIDVVNINRSMNRRNMTDARPAMVDPVSETLGADNVAAIESGIDDPAVLGAHLVAIQRAIAEREAAQADKGFFSGAARNKLEIENLRKYEKFLKEEHSLAENVSTLQKNLEANRKDIRIAQQQDSEFYKGLDTDLAKLEREFGQVHADALKIPRGQPQRREEVYNQGTEKLGGRLDDVEGTIQSAINAGMMSQEAAAPLLTRLATLRGTDERTSKDFFTAGTPLRRQQYQKQTRATRAALTTLTQDLRKPGSDRDALLSQGDQLLDNLAQSLKDEYLSGVENYDAADPLNNDPAVIAALASIDDEIAERRNQLRNTRARSSGGGSRRDPFEKREFNTLMDGFKTRFTEAEVGMEIGRVGGKDALQTMKTVVSEAERALAIRKEELEALQAKREAGTLTNEEQKRANALVNEEKTLLDFIRQRKKDVLEVSKELGVAQANINATVNTWAQKNLNVGETLTSGITSALSTVKSAMSELFTSWANGTKSGKQAFKDFAISVIKSIQNIFAEMLTVMILKKALGWMGFGADSGVGEAFNAATGVSLAREGTVVKKAASGTIVKGNLNRDSQLYSLMPGEGVLTRSAVQAIGEDEVHRLNAMGNNVVQASSHQGAANQSSKPSPTSRDMNIYLVDERSQAGSLGPNDILAIVNDDIARGGTTKKLIKTVQMGGM